MVSTISVRMKRQISGKRSRVTSHTDSRPKFGWEREVTRGQQSSRSHWTLGSHGKLLSKRMAQKGGGDFARLPFSPACENIRGSEDMFTLHALLL